MKMEMPTEQYWNICYGQPQWLSSSFSTSLANGNEGVGLRMWWDNEIRQDLLENSFGGTSGSVHQQPLPPPAPSVRQPPAPGVGTSTVSSTPKVSQHGQSATTGMGGSIMQHLQQQQPRHQQMEMPITTVPDLTPFIDLTTVPMEMVLDADGELKLMFSSLSTPLASGNGDVGAFGGTSGPVHQQVSFSTGHDPSLTAAASASSSASANSIVPAYTGSVQPLANSQILSNIAVGPSHHPSLLDQQPSPLRGNEQQENINPNLQAENRHLALARQQLSAALARIDELETLVKRKNARRATYGG